MELPTTCPNAGTFNTIMLDIWDGALHELYDTWHDANAVANYYGMKKYRNSKRGTGKTFRQGYLYTFVDGSRVFVAQDGSAIEHAV